MCRCSAKALLEVADANSSERTVVRCFQWSRVVTVYRSPDRGVGLKDRKISMGLETRRVARGIQVPEKLKP